MDYFSLAVLLAAIGIILFVAEYFIPTGGVLIVFGILVCVGAVAVVAMNTEDHRETLAAVVALCVGVPVIGTAGISLLGKRYALKAGDLEPSGELLKADEGLLGRVGKTLTPMRPAGAVAFDGRRVDAVSEGVPLEAGVWVKCVEARGLRIVVRQIPKPPDLNEINIDDFK